MNQNKKMKLAALLPLLDELQEQVRLVNMRQAQKANSIIYAPLSSVIYGSKMTSKVAWQDSIKELKVVRAAKGLTIQASDDISALFVQLAEAMEKRINIINPTSKLVPKMRRIEQAMAIPWSEASLFASGLYQNYITDMFHQGRMHQSVYNHKMSLKKFASLSIQDNNEAYYTEQRLSKQFEIAFTKFSSEFKTELSEVVKSGSSRGDVMAMIDVRIISASSGFVEMVRKHVAEAYAAGNLYQMANDKVQWVRWQTGQHNSDCGRCRAIQMGDILLPGISHQRLDFDSVVYSLSDILVEAKEKGARIFNHHDCRCSFIPH